MKNVWKVFLIVEENLIGNEFLSLYIENDRYTYCIEDGKTLMRDMLADILVAPVIEEGSTERNVYIPEGKWLNIFDGKMYEGKQNILVKADKETISKYIKLISKYKFVCENKQLIFELK